MAKIPWKSWREVVTLGDDLKSGELTIRVFSAGFPELRTARRGSVPLNPIWPQCRPGDKAQ